MATAYELLTGARADRHYIAECCHDTHLMSERLEYWQRVMRPKLRSHAMVALPTTGPSKDELFE